ncbi:MAG: transposase [Desulfatibacillaceae bacterium]
MYIRTVSNRNEDGSVEEHVQLARDREDPLSGVRSAQVLLNFGNRDDLDEEALRTLVNGLAGFLGETEQASGPAVPAHGGPVAFLDAKPVGSSHVLRGLWDRVGMDGFLREILAETGYDPQVGAAIFAMVANRALAPNSPLPVETWGEREAHLYLDCRPEARHFYRASEFLLEHEKVLKEHVSRSLGDLYDAEVDLVLLEAATRYFSPQNTHGDGGLDFPSRQRRHDADRVVAALAITREGLPVRSWIFPPDAPHGHILKEVRADLDGLTPSRVFRVVDPRVGTETGRFTPSEGEGHCVFIEKLCGATMRKVGPRQPGRFRNVGDDLQVKEVALEENEGTGRVMVVLNRDKAKRDRDTRVRLVEWARREIEAVEALAGQRRARAARALLAHPTMGWYIKELKTGQLRINKGRISEEERFDGKYLLSTDDRTRSAEELALSYQRILEIERAFRTLNTTLGPRPVYLTNLERIRVQATQCWMALLLVRIAERATGLTWKRIRAVMDRLKIERFTVGYANITQSTAITAEQAGILESLNMDPPETVSSVHSPA